MLATLGSRADRLRALGVKISITSGVSRGGGAFTGDLFLVEQGEQQRVLAIFQGGPLVEQQQHVLAILQGEPLVEQ